MMNAFRFSCYQRLPLEYGHSGMAIIFGHSKPVFIAFSDLRTQLLFESSNFVNRPNFILLSIYITKCSLWIIWIYNYNFRAMIHFTVIFQPSPTSQRLVSERTCDPEAVSPATKDTKLTHAPPRLDKKEEPMDSTWWRYIIQLDVIKVWINQQWHWIVPLWLK